MSDRCKDLFKIMQDPWSYDIDLRRTRRRQQQDQTSIVVKFKEKNQCAICQAQEEEEAALSGSATNWPQMKHFRPVERP